MRSLKAGDLQIPPAMYKSIMSWILPAYKKMFYSHGRVRADLDHYNKFKSQMSKKHLDELFYHEILGQVDEAASDTHHFPLDFRGWAYADRFRDPEVQKRLRQAFPRGLKVSLMNREMMRKNDITDNTEAVYRSNEGWMIIGGFSQGENPSYDVKQIGLTVRHELQHVVQRVFGVLRGKDFLGGGFGKKRNIRPEDQEFYVGLKAEYKTLLRDAVRATTDEIREGSDEPWSLADVKEMLETYSANTVYKSPFKIFEYYRRFNKGAHRQATKEYYVAVMKELKRRPEFYNYVGNRRSKRPLQQLKGLEGRYLTRK